jgi:proteic killer suppression protein
MIASFKDADTRRLWETGKSRRIPAKIRRVAGRKLAMLNNVKDVELLRIPPANRLEKLTGDRKGQYSIRVNDQYRICFRWLDGNAHEVEIVDYH